MRYVVFGAGAVGSSYGGLLVHHGREVVLVGRPAHVAVIREKGLTLERIGDVLNIPINAEDHISKVEPRPDDVVLLAVKTQQTVPALEALRLRFPAETPVVGFQNGARNEALIVESFPNVYGALINFNANYLAPGVVRRTILDQVVFGRYPEGTDSLTARFVADAREIGFRSVEHPRIMNLKWGKLLANLNNATLALQGLWLQKALSLPRNVAFMRDVLAEGMRVLDAAGIDYADPLDVYDIRRTFDKMLSRHGPKTAGDSPEIPESERSYPSTWQDLKLGRAETEVEWLNGEIVRMGRELGIPTPFNDVLLEGVRTSLREGGGPGRYTLDELRSLVVGHWSLVSRATGNHADKNQ